MFVCVQPVERIFYGVVNCGHMFLLFPQQMFLIIIIFFISFFFAAGLSLLQLITRASRGCAALSYSYFKMMIHWERCQERVSLSPAAAVLHDDLHHKTSRRLHKNMKSHQHHFARQVPAININARRSAKLLVFRFSHQIHTSIFHNYCNAGMQ